MTLPVSGPISLSDIRGEFGDTAPDSLSEYYRGGGLVPDIPDNSSIPTSGSINLSDFYGTRNQIIQVSGGSAQDFNGAGGTSTAGISFETNGNYTTIGNSGTGSDWGVPNVTGLGNDYQIRATLSSGVNPSSGTMNSWLNLSSTRNWTNSIGGGAGTRLSVITIAIRDSATMTIINSGSYTIEASSEF